MRGASPFFCNRKLKLGEAKTWRAAGILEAFSKNQQILTFSRAVNYLLSITGPHSSGGHKLGSESVRNRKDRKPTKKCWKFRKRDVLNSALKNLYCHLPSSVESSIKRCKIPTLDCVSNAFVSTSETLTLLRFYTQHISCLCSFFCSLEVMRPIMPDCSILLRQRNTILCLSCVPTRFLSYVIPETSKKAVELAILRSTLPWEREFRNPSPVQRRK